MRIRRVFELIDYDLEDNLFKEIDTLDLSTWLDLHEIEEMNEEENTIITHSISKFFDLNRSRSTNNGGPVLYNYLTSKNKFFNGRAGQNWFIKNGGDITINKYQDEWYIVRIYGVGKYSWPDTNHHFFITDTIEGIEKLIINTFEF